MIKIDDKDSVFAIINGRKCDFKVANHSFWICEGDEFQMIHRLHKWWHYSRKRVIK